jgi:NAD(P)-dependent dehydrogenase (short-subunit alcohol dehydrogenase family)
MKSKEIIAAVTGGNRGIGLEICRQLAERGVRVILTARSAKAGQEALAKLAGMKLPPEFYPLDVTSEQSIKALQDLLEKTFGRVDVLINNAGIISDDDTSGLTVKLATVRETVETNALAPLRLAQAFAPLLKKSSRARIINVSSGMGSFSNMDSDHAAYRISKAALNAASTILAAELRGVAAVNSVCPGWVRTDMGGANAERDVAQGADGIVWLALDAPQELTGNFLRDRKVIPW